MNGKCRDCFLYKSCRDDHISWIFFIIGIISAIAIRSVTFLMDISDIYGRLAWYVGVGGFFIFFIYKFRINQYKSRLVIESNLREKIAGRRLEDTDYEIIASILCSLTSRKERINYFFIFGLSALALIVAVYFDFIK